MRAGRYLICDMALKNWFMVFTRQKFIHIPTRSAVQHSFILLTRFYRNVKLIKQVP